MRNTVLLLYIYAVCIGSLVVANKCEAAALVAPQEYNLDSMSMEELDAREKELQRQIDDEEASQTSPRSIDSMSLEELNARERELQSEISSSSQKRLSDLLALSDKLEKMTKFIADSTDGDDEYKAIHDEAVASNEMLANNKTAFAKLSDEDVKWFTKDVEKKYKDARKRQCAADGEYDDLLILPWVDDKVDHGMICFRRPRCVIAQQIAEQYRDVMLFNGTIKLAAGNVVVGFSLAKYAGAEAPDGLRSGLKKLFSATAEEMTSPEFIRSISALAGRNDVVKYGGTKVGGKNAFWSMVKMERRVGDVVAYRGLQKVYLIPVKGGAQFLSATFLVGASGVGRMPYADFNAFKPAGEKFIKSIVIRDKPKWKFW